MYVDVSKCCYLIKKEKQKCPSPTGVYTWMQLALIKHRVRYQYGIFSSLPTTTLRFSKAWERNALRSVAREDLHRAQTHSTLPRIWCKPWIQTMSKMSSISDLKRSTAPKIQEKHNDAKDRNHGQTWFGHDFPAGQFVSVCCFLIAATTRYSGFFRLSLVTRFACDIGQWAKIWIWVSSEVISICI